MILFRQFSYSVVLVRMMNNMKKSRCLYSLGLHLLFQGVLHCELIAKNGKLSSQFVPLSEQSKLGRLNGVHIFSKLRHFSLEKFLLTFQLFFRVLQLRDQPHRFPPLLSKETLHPMKLINLFLRQMHLLVSIPRPPRRIPSQRQVSDLFLEDISMVNSSMHEIAMHCRKERIDNLLKVILKLSLSLLAIRAYPILHSILAYLNEVQQQVDAILIGVFTIGGALQFSKGEGMLVRVLTHMQLTFLEILMAQTSWSLHFDISKSQCSIYADSCFTLASRQPNCFFFFSLDFKPANLFFSTFYDPLVPQSTEPLLIFPKSSSDCSRSSSSKSSSGRLQGCSRPEMKAVGEMRRCSLQESMRSCIFANSQSLIDQYIIKNLLEHSQGKKVESFEGKERFYNSGGEIYGLRVVVEV